MDMDVFYLDDAVACSSACMSTSGNSSMPGTPSPSLYDWYIPCSPDQPRQNTQQNPSGCHWLPSISHLQFRHPDLLPSEALLKLVPREAVVDLPAPRLQHAPVLVCIARRGRRMNRCSHVCVPRHWRALHTCLLTSGTLWSNTRPLWALWAPWSDAAATTEKHPIRR